MRGLLRIALLAGSLALPFDGALALTPGTVTPVADANQLMANAKALPYIVLVPGALGSRIEACPKFSDICKTLWGGVVLEPDDYSLIIKDDKKNYRLSVVDKLAFIDIYEPIVTFIQAHYDRFRSDRWIGFAYDWRRSVSDAAEKLGKRVCEIVDLSDSDAHFVFIGHSMGGLVIKEWMRKFAASGCADGVPVRVDRAVFVATPHLGAAIVVDSVVDGYSLFASKQDTFLRRMIAKIGDKLFAKAIDEGGLTFKSTFDLLPIATSAACQQQSSKPLNRDVGVFVRNLQLVDIFDSAYWSDLGLLNGHGDAAAIDALLPRVKVELDRASKDMCALRNFDPATVAAKVTYVVGQLSTKDWWGKPKGVDQRSTIARVTLAVRKNKRPTVTPGPYAGDGTVDIRSASNEGISSRDQLRFTDSGHKDAINSIEVRKIVDEIFIQAEQDAAALASAARPTATYVANTAEDAVATGTFVPWDSDPDSWSTPENMLADSINKGVTDELGIDGVQSYRMARDETDPLRRLALYSLSAKLNVDNPLLQAWSFTRAAHLSFELADYQSAMGNVSAALIAVEGVQGVQAKDIRRQLSTTLAATRNKLNPPAN